MTIKDPCHPTVDEIWEWAWDSSSLEPIQDWDIIIGNLYPREYLKIAKLPHCPGRRYFLSILYLLVGDAHRRNSWDTIMPLVTEEMDSDCVPVKRWAHRSLSLKSGKMNFKYDEWCAGGLVREDLGLA